MFNYTSNYSNTNGIKLHYYRTGGSKPPLVMVHGISDDGLCWAPIAEVYAGRFDVIMVDMRGHGLSEAPADGYTTTHMARDLAGLIQSLGLSKPMVLGHSMGAISTLTMAGMFPDLPGAILLEDPPAFWMIKATDPAPDESNNPLKNWMTSVKRKTHDDLLAEARTNNPTWPEAEIEPWINSKHRFSLNILSVLRMTDLAALDYSNLLKKVSCPGLLMYADQDRGAILTDQVIKVLRQAVPQIQVVHIAGAGHSIRRDQPNAYLSAIDQFLSGLTD